MLAELTSDGTFREVAAYGVHTVIGIHARWRAIPGKRLTGQDGPRRLNGAVREATKSLVVGNHRCGRVAVVGITYKIREPWDA